MKTILVTGGAGYIGSHTLRALNEHGFRVLCLDDLSTGFREFVGSVPLIVGTLSDRGCVDRAFSADNIDAVIHFASHALVEESCRNPHKYYRDNIQNGLNLLESMRAHGVGLIVFSSSCSVYGIPASLPIRETSPLDPVNPYGFSKMVIERILHDYGQAHGLRSVSLRYFNAAGASAVGGIGEWHDPETHLIPRLFQVALGQAPAAAVYGRDYPTPDGTCVRDYIHVTDLAEAHAAALEYLFLGGASDVFNLGTGQGCSVLQVVRQVESTAGRTLPISFMDRRAGDPPELVADPAKARRVLGWVARHSSLEQIIGSAWNWHRADHALLGRP
jgi:UDP-glucose-4-epimerase GalE